MDRNYINSPNVMHTSYVDKVFYAKYYMKCSGCDCDILEGEEFKYFDANKICLNCWDKLIGYFNTEVRTWDGTK